MNHTFSNFKLTVFPVQILLVSLGFILIFSCCSGNKTAKAKTKLAPAAVQKKIYKINSPNPGQIVKPNDVFSINLGGDQEPDSVLLIVNQLRQRLQKNGPMSYSAQIQDKTVGTRDLQLNIHYSDSLSETQSIKLLVVSQTAPVQHKYKLIRSFPHDAGAYTQGLVYHHNVLFESTGRKTQSSIRKIDPKTGEVLKKKLIEPEHFGEGIAIIDNELFMLTYVSQVGFVFDVNSFDLIRKFNLQTREGWGLTSMNNQLVLSDGTASLYFYDPAYFSLMRQIEVCDHQGRVTNLNELEYTPNGIFANVYGENFVVLIDPETGIVKSKVDLSGLFPPNVPETYDYVLNGIAYNQASNTFYVTGKQWPVMYEIQIILE